MRDMTNGSPIKHIIKFTLPMFAGNIFQQFYNVADSIIVGRFIGKEALASVGASFPIIFFIVSIIMGATMGSSVLISQFYGAKQMDNLSKTIETTYIYLFITAIIVTILGLTFSEKILLLLKTPPDILHNANIYLKWTFIGMIFLFGYNSISAILRGLGDSKSPLYFLIISSILNIFLDIILITKFKMGISGAAIATIISQGVSFLLCVLYLELTNHDVLRFKVIGLTFDYDIFIKSLKIGLPTGIQQMLVSLGMMIIIRIVNGFGTNVVAAFTAASRIDAFAMMPAMNIGMALTTFTAQNMGAKKYDRIKSGLKSGILFGSTLTLIISLLIIICGDFLLGLFVKDNDVIKIGKEYLIIICSFYFIFSIMQSFIGLFRGCGDTLVSMFITLITLWIIRIPLAEILSRIFGYHGIWWSLPAGWFIGTTLSYIYFTTGKWKKNIIKGNADI